MNSRLNVQTGLMEYDNFLIHANTVMEFDQSDAIIIKRSDDTPVLKVQQHCGDLVYSYPRCNGEWESKRHKLTSRFLQETSLVNITGYRCIQIDCSSRITGLSINHIVGT
jgi:hypothetical protein